MYYTSAYMKRLQAETAAKLAKDELASAEQSRAVTKAARERLTPLKSRVARLLEDIPLELQRMRPTCAQGHGRRVRRRCALGYAATAVGALTATSMRAFQAQGINSSILAMGWSGKVASTLASQARGSTSLSLQVVTSE